LQANCIRGNNELEYYTPRTVNAVIDSGNLLIIARKERYSGSDYTSARLKTQGLRSFTYGRVEARIKLPVGQGLWPAFWMLGTSISQVSWPRCGEIDIMEHVSNVPLVYGTMHWDNNGHSQYGGNVACDVKEYHVYSVEWTADAITWFVDGAQYCVGDIANNINSTNEFHAPFFIILNLAVGGGWPGIPDSTTPFPDTMFVDYVRVYQLSTGVNDGDEKMPKEAGLKQNYPNPFNPETNIRYQVSDIRNVKVSVSDLLGREVAVLVNERRNAGVHEVKFDGSHLASGVYICRLEAGDVIQTRKLVLLR